MPIELIIECITFLAAIYLISRTFVAYFEQKAAAHKKASLMARLKHRKMKKEEEDDMEYSLLEGLMQEVGLPPETAVIAKAALPGIITNFLKSQKQPGQPGEEGKYS